MSVDDNDNKHLSS